MRKILLTLSFISFIFSSCKTIYHEETTVLDFREYNKQGFTISPTASGFGYKPVSEINISFYNGKKISEDLKEKKGIEFFVNKSTNESYYYPTPKRILDKTVEECKNMGANGIVNFRLTRINGDKGYWNVSGVAVSIDNEE